MEKWLTSTDLQAQVGRLRTISIGTPTRTGVFDQTAVADAIFKRCPDVTTLWWFGDNEMETVYRLLCFLGQLEELRLAAPSAELYTAAGVLMVDVDVEQFKGDQVRERGFHD